MAKKGKGGSTAGICAETGLNRASIQPPVEFAPDRHFKNFNEEQKIFLKSIQDGNTIKYATNAAGVTRYCVRKWEEDKEFSLAYEAAKEDRIDDIEEKAFQVAKQGHWPAVQKILESHRPETYGVKSKQDLNVSGTIIIEEKKYEFSDKPAK